MLVLLSHFMKQILLNKQTQSFILQTLFKMLYAFHKNFF